MDKNEARTEIRARPWTVFSQACIDVGYNQVNRIIRPLRTFRLAKALPVAIKGGLVKDDPDVGGHSMPAKAAALIADMQAKRQNWLNPEVRAIHQQVVNWSRAWDAKGPIDPATAQSYESIRKKSEERSPRSRLCLPHVDRMFWDTIRPELARQHISYARIPVHAQREEWYFLQTLDHVRALMDCLPEQAITPAGEGEDLWKQRIRIPYNAENYHLHLAEYLHDNKVRFVRILAKQEGYSLIFVNSVLDVRKLFDGLSAFELPTLQSV